MKLFFVCSTISVMASEYKEQEKTLSLLAPVHQSMEQPDVRVLLARAKTPQERLNILDEELGEIYNRADAGTQHKMDLYVIEYGASCRMCPCCYLVSSKKKILRGLTKEIIEGRDPLEYEGFPPLFDCRHIEARNPLRLFNSAPLIEYRKAFLACNPDTVNCKVLSEKFDPNKPTIEGWYPINKLLESAIEIQSNGSGYESESRMVACKKLLLRGARIDLPTAQGDFPLGFAIKSLSLTRVMCEHIKKHNLGAELDRKNSSGNTALHMVADLVKSGHRFASNAPNAGVSIPFELLNVGANPHIKNRYGLTFVQLASGNLYLEAAIALHEKKCKNVITDQCGLPAVLDDMVADYI